MLKSEKNIDARMYVLGSVIFIILSRCYFYFISKIEPNSSYLILHWHHLSLEALSSQLLVSIINLHSQPPLWNIIIGFSAKVCHGSVGCSVHILHLFNIILSIVIFFLLRDILYFFLKNDILSTAASVIFCMSPAIVFYENYIMYPHLTMFLSTLLCWGALKFIVLDEVIGLSFFSISLIGLSWTWTLFHPAFVALLIYIVCINGVRRPSQSMCMLVVFVTLFVSSLPSIKNFIKFDFFTGSTWIGLNLAQVAPDTSFDCSFYAFKQTFPEDIHTGTAFNDNSIIPLSKRCRDEAIYSIITHPFAYLRFFLFRLVVSMSVFPSNYGLQPLNWQNFPFQNEIGILRDSEGHLETPSTRFRLVSVIINAPYLMSCFFLMLTEDKSKRHYFSFCSIYVALFIIIAHAVNAYEQERMRYTIDSTLWVSLIVTIERLKQRLIARL